jgi:hypothetical protein
LSAQKKRIFQYLYDREIDREGGNRSKELTWTNEDPKRFSPFCGIRSGDILEVMAQHLDVIELHTAGTISALMLYTKPADDIKLSLSFRVQNRLTRLMNRVLPGGPRRLRRLVVDSTFMDEMLLMDDVLCDEGLLVPFNAFAVYRKHRGRTP